MLNKPEIGSAKWGVDVNNNWSLIEQYMNGDTEKVWGTVQVKSIDATFYATNIASPRVERDTITNLKDSSGTYADIITGDYTDNDGGIYTVDYNKGTVQTISKPIITLVIKTGASSGDLQECRIWMGLFSADPMASDTPSSHLAAFRYAPATDTTAYWRCVTDDGVGAPTVTATDIEIEADTRYVLKVDCSDPASIKFYINGTLVATHTTDLPSTSQDLGCWMQIRTLESAAKNIRISKLDILI